MIVFKQCDTGMCLSPVLGPGWDLISALRQLRSVWVPELLILLYHLGFDNSFMRLASRLQHWKSDAVPSYNVFLLMCLAWCKIKELVFLPCLPRCSKLYQWLPSPA